MSQRCPICKSRLWTDPLFSPAKLVCPRCGATFKTTVPWASFRILVIVVLVLSLALIFFLVGERPWLLAAFLGGLFIFLWYLPRLINLQHISDGLKLSDGVMDVDQVNLDFDQRLTDQKEGGQEERLFRGLMGLTLLVVLLTIALVWILRFR